MKPKARSIALASAVKINESSDLRPFQNYFSFVHFSLQNSERVKRKEDVTSRITNIVTEAGIDHVTTTYGPMFISLDTRSERVYLPC